MHLLRRNGSPCNNRVEDALDKRSVEETPVRSSPDFLPWITLLLHREFSNLTRVSGYAYLRSVVSGAFFLDSEKKKKIEAILWFIHSLRWVVLQRSVSRQRVDEDGGVRGWLDERYCVEKDLWSGGTVGESDLARYAGKIWWEKLSGEGFRSTRSIRATRLIPCKVERKKRCSDYCESRLRRVMGNVKGKLHCRRSRRIRENCIHLD